MNEKILFLLNSTLDLVRDFLGDHRDAVDDWANTQAQVATCWKIRELKFEWKCLRSMTQRSMTLIDDLTVNDLLKDF